MAYRFDEFTFDPAKRLLMIRNEVVLLEPKVLGLLAILVRHHTRVVPRAVIVRELWEGVSVGDGSLSRHRIWADLQGANPDGICLDAEGAIWAACPNRGEVIRVRPGGERVMRQPTSTLTRSPPGRRQTQYCSVLARQAFQPDTSGTSGWKA